MKIKLTRRIPYTPSNVTRLTSDNTRYEIYPVKESTRIFEEIFDFSNIESLWLSPAQGEAILEMARPFTMEEKTLLPTIVDEEEIWICSDGTFTELHIMVDAFEYFEVL